MSDRYVGYHYPKFVIGYAVFLYHRFSLSLRVISELLAEQSTVVTYEMIGWWCKTFVHQFVKRTTKRLPHRSYKVHMDEVRIVIKGEVYWLWRVIDNEGDDYLTQLIETIF